MDSEKAILTLIVVWGAILAICVWGNPRARWTGRQWTCPAGYVVYADENEALAGKAEYVHCVSGE